MLLPLHSLKKWPLSTLFWGYIVKIQYKKVKLPFKNLLQCTLINWFCQYVTKVENNKYVVLVTPIVLIDMQD
jgi:hypothetical protein